MTLFQVYYFHNENNESIINEWNIIASKIVEGASITFDHFFKNDYGDIIYVIEVEKLLLEGVNLVVNKFTMGTDCCIPYSVDHYIKK